VIADESISMATEPTDSPSRATHVPQLNSWRSLAYWKKRLIAISVAIAAIATIIGNLEKILDAGRKAYSIVVPSVEISPGIIGNDNNAMAAEFIFMNTGTLPLLSNEIECSIRAANGPVHTMDNFIISPGRDNAQFVARLDPGKPATRNCGEIIGDFMGFVAQYPATFTIRLSSKWPSFWQHFAWTTQATFVGIREADGHIKIQPDNP
jgi:hypothetical protein